jgi:hypothetical protein
MKRRRRRRRRTPSHSGDSPTRRRSHGVLCYGRSVSDVCTAVGPGEVEDWRCLRDAWRLKGLAAKNLGRASSYLSALHRAD